MSFEPAKCPKHPSQQIVGVCGSCLAERLSLLTSVDVDCLGCPPSSPNLAADVSFSALVEHDSGHVQQAIAYIPPRNENITTLSQVDEENRCSNRNEEEITPVLQVDDKNRYRDRNEEEIAPALPSDRSSNDRGGGIAPVVLRDRCSSHKEVEITPVFQRDIRNRWRSKSLCEGKTGGWPGLEEPVTSASGMKATQLRSRTLRALFEIEDGKEPEKELAETAGAAAEEASAHRRRICGGEGGGRACLYGCVTCAASSASSSASSSLRSPKAGGRERPGLGALFWKKEREGEGRKKKKATKEKRKQQQQQDQKVEEEEEKEKGKKKEKEEKKKQKQRKVGLKHGDVAMAAKTDAMEGNKDDGEEGEEEGEDDDEERGGGEAERAIHTGAPTAPRQRSWEAAELDSRSERRFNLTARALAAARATLPVPDLTAADAGITAVDSAITASYPDITAADGTLTAAEGTLAESCGTSPPRPYGRSFSSCAAIKTPPPPPLATAASLNAAVSKAKLPPSRYYLRRISPATFDQSGLLRFYLTPHRTAGRSLRSRVLPAGRRLPRSASKTLFVYK